MFKKYFKKRDKRKWVERHWEVIAKNLASCPITQDLPRGEVEEVIRTVSSSCSLYPDNALTKASLKLIGAAKRILVDRRQFDLLKSIDYLVACHNVSKYKIEKAAKQALLAYYCQMAHRYLDIVTAGQETNPFHAGAILGGKNDRKHDQAAE